MKRLLNLCLLFSAISLFAHVGISIQTPRSGSANLPEISSAERESFVYLAQNQLANSIEVFEFSAVY